MSDFLLAIDAAPDMEDRFVDTSRRMVRRPWQDLYLFRQPGGVALAWTRSDADFHYKTYPDGLVLLMGTGWRDDRPFCESAADLIHAAIDDDAALAAAVRGFSGRHAVIAIRGKRVVAATSVLGTFNVFHAEDRNTGAHVFASKQQFLNALSPREVDYDGIRQRCLFMTNYRSTYLQGVRRLDHDAACVVDVGRAWCDVPLGRLNALKASPFDDFDQASRETRALILESMTAKLAGGP
jgi:hypothetical protein